MRGEVGRIVTGLALLVLLNFGLAMAAHLFVGVF